MSKYKLRPHHVLCIYFFEGKGYSPEFVENMTDVIRTLEGTSLVQLTDSVDIICVKCPNNNQHICEHDVKVKCYDEAVLSVCQLEVGQVLEWQELSELVSKLIIRPHKLRTVCGDCEWSTLCQRG
jgi:hypothetical protein